MAGTGVGKFSSTAGSNTANMTVNFAENMAPSNVNNAARELMGHMRDMYEQLGDGYFEFGDGDGTYTVARGDADTITITSQQTSQVYILQVERLESLMVVLMWSKALLPHLLTHLLHRL